MRIIVVLKCLILVDKRFESLMSCGMRKTLILLKYFDRFITIMIYLNDVEEGGETAFPAANNKTYDEEVIVIVDRS